MMKSVFLAVALLVSGFTTIASAEQCGNYFCGAGQVCQYSRCLPGDSCYQPPHCVWANNYNDSDNQVSYQRPEVTTPYTICRDTSRGGRGYPVSTRSGGPYVCSEQGFPNAPQYYGGHLTGQPYYFCCYDPDTY